MLTSLQRENLNKGLERRLLQGEFDNDRLSYLRAFMAINQVNSYQGFTFEEYYAYGAIYGAEIQSLKYNELLNRVTAQGTEFVVAPGSISSGGKGASINIDGLELSGYAAESLYSTVNSQGRIDWANSSTGDALADAYRGQALKNNGTQWNAEEGKYETKGEREYREQKERYEHKQKEKRDKQRQNANPNGGGPLIASNEPGAGVLKNNVVVIPQDGNKPFITNGKFKGLTIDHNDNLQIYGGKDSRFYDPAAGWTSIHIENVEGGEFKFTDELGTKLTANPENRAHFGDPDLVFFRYNHNRYQPNSWTYGVVRVNTITHNGIRFATHTGWWNQASGGVPDWPE